VVDRLNAPSRPGPSLIWFRRFYDACVGPRRGLLCAPDGDPIGPADGYIDPQSAADAAFPRTIMVPAGPALLQPDIRGILGISRPPPCFLRHQGNIGLGPPPMRPLDEWSSVFLFLFTRNSTPAGLNLIRRRTRLGYVVDGFEVLEELTGSGWGLLSHRAGQGRHLRPWLRAGSDPG